MLAETQNSQPVENSMENEDKKPDEKPAGLVGKSKMASLTSDEARRYHYNADTDRIINHPALRYDAKFREYFSDKYRDNGYSLCPFHPDTTPSHDARSDHGRCYGGCPEKRPGAAYKKHTVINLYALKFGCSWKEARKALAKEIGLELSRSYDPNTFKGKPIVKTYDYRDENGELLYQECRLDPKDFRMRRPDGNGGWIWKMGNTRRVLYRLPEVINAETVWFVEGEKDADNVSALGLCGTTAPNGAEKVPNLHSRFRILECLRGKTVILIGDNDETGRQHVQQIAQLLHDIAGSVKIIYLQGLPEKGDVSDSIEIHGKERAKELLLEHIAAAPEYEPSAEQTQNNTPIDLTPPPTSLDEAETKVHEIIDKIKDSPGLAMRDEYMIAIETVQAQNDELFITLKTVLDRKRIWTNVRKKLDKRRLSIAKNEPPRVTVEEALQQCALEAPPGCKDLHMPKTYAFRDRKTFLLSNGPNGQYNVSSPVGQNLREKGVGRTRGF